MKLVNVQLLIKQADVVEAHITSSSSTN